MDSDDSFGSLDAFIDDDPIDSQETLPLTQGLSSSDSEISLDLDDSSSSSGRLSTQSASSSDEQRDSSPEPQEVRRSTRNRPEAVPSPAPSIEVIPIDYDDDHDIEEEVLRTPPPGNHEDADVIMVARVTVTPPRVRYSPIPVTPRRSEPGPSTSRVDAPGPSPRRSEPVSKRARVEEAGTSADAPTTAKLFSDDEEDGCTICYEDINNAGDHRLVSLKCGHFFGQQCIARWIRGEDKGRVTYAGRAASCPSCKTKCTQKDIRIHFTKAVKMRDTSELEGVKAENKKLTDKIAELEVVVARKDRRIRELTQEAQQAQERIPPQVVVRGGKMIVAPITRTVLTKEVTAGTRAFDHNGIYFAVGVRALGNMFSPYAIRYVDWKATSREFIMKDSTPLHANRSRVVAFSPFESNLILSGGEDKAVIVHEMGFRTCRKKYNVPNSKHVWSGCWLDINRIAVGTQDGRVWEYDLNLDTTEPVRDITKAIGVMPIIFLISDVRTKVVLAGSFKRIIAYKGETATTILCNANDNFETIRSATWDDATASIMVTFTAQTNKVGISHRLYKIEVEEETVTAVHMKTWQTQCFKASTLWTNCLFSIGQNVFAVVYNEDNKRLDCYDWSGKRAPVMLRFHDGNVYSMRSFNGADANAKVVSILTDRCIYAIDFRVRD